LWVLKCSSMMIWGERYVLEETVDASGGYSHLYTLTW
jgi:hypothetical protein